ncbi:DedA family protein [Micromonospora sp. NPDC051300]|uniref:DedA family protein n=1 Tax=Micromonospora sp. NPDC051300 TaxID=3364286 RepID=UPI0037BB656D
MLHDVLLLASSPWLFVVVALVVALDGVAPVLPAETLVITLGALAAGGRPSLAPLVAAVAVGSFAGDLLAYRLGWFAADRLTRHTRPSRWDGRLRRAVDRRRSGLHRHGDLAVLLGRYLPGGRTAAALSSGAVRSPRRRFLPCSAVGSTAWAGYIVGLGYLGGAAFAHQPRYALLPGLLAATATTTIGLIVRRVARSRRARAAAAPVTVPRPPAGAVAAPPARPAAATVGSPRPRRPAGPVLRLPTTVRPLRYSPTEP